MIDKLRVRYFPHELGGGVVAHPVSQHTYHQVRDALFDLVFPQWQAAGRYEPPPQRYAAAGHLRRIYLRLHHERFVFYDGSQAVGWSVGRMENPATFRMATSGVLEEYRRRGLYSSFTRRLLDYLRAVGYERVTSSHHPTNRAMIEAKLKLGFNISGTLLYEDIGAVIEMVCFLHEDRRQAFEHRLGAEPDFTYGEQD